MREVRTGDEVNEEGWWKSLRASGGRLEDSTSGELEESTRPGRSEQGLETGYIPSLLIASTFPSLASFPCVFVPPTGDAWTEARKPCEERRNEEICF